MRFLLCGQGTSEILWSIHAALIDLGHESVLALPDISQELIDRRIDVLFVLNLFEIPRPTVEMLRAYIGQFGAEPAIIHICLKHPLEEIGAGTVEQIREADRWMTEHDVSMWCMCRGSAEQAVRLGLTRVFHQPLGVHSWIYTAPAADGSVDLYKRWMAPDTPGLRRHPYGAMRGQTDVDAEASVRDRFLYLGQGWPDHLESGREPVPSAIRRDAEAVAAAMTERPMLDRLQAMDTCGLTDRSADPAWTLDFNRAFTIAFAVENRRRFAAALRHGLGDGFALRGNGWARFGIEAGPVSPAPRNAYSAAAACLDFGSLAYDTAIFPRTLEIVKRGGLLVSWRHADTDRLFGPQEDELTFVDEADAVRLLSALAKESDRRARLRSAHLEHCFDALALTAILPRVVGRAGR
ncbi:glycosyltransferase family 1 protein [Azospirillum sp. YIM B02556]|uniref:Glycosyltransferase family 1 protein n=1 Tax=Azospirillum endophyticum TaxID=2800326 RepID=A0ABS1FEK5_9PROT|nr:glycosyltransferase [Azospirillum endophyticum]MBK1841867.1 glycosyltransferase family 1 protein [Azospirillum endophyticum]